ncbi:MAG: 1,4-dihydroxy-6-naphthoate synthase [Lachnospiraceae bacterium]|nr:1,4-dihydroxy-6-naphthoate synthase [Lachnospiraceae bacterium]
MYDNLYCKVFIDTSLSYEELFSIIIDFTGGKKESFRDIAADWCDISVRKNKEYSLEQYLSDPTDFIYWKYFLDMEPGNIEERGYIKRVADLLKHLKEHCTGVFAACDFEEELEEKGND